MMTLDELRAYTQELMSSDDETPTQATGYYIRDCTDTLGRSVEETLGWLKRNQLIYSGSQLRRYLAIVENIEK